MVPPGPPLSPLGRHRPGGRCWGPPGHLALLTLAGGALAGYDSAAAGTAAAGIAFSVAGPMRHRGVATLLLVFGLGGVATEVIAGHAARLSPLTDQDADALNPLIARPDGVWVADARFRAGPGTMPDPYLRRLRG